MAERENMTRTGLIFAALAVALIASLYGNAKQYLDARACAKEFDAYVKIVELDDLARREGLTTVQRLAVSKLIEGEAR